MQGADAFDLTQASDPPASPEALTRWQEFYANALEDAAQRTATDTLICAIPEALPDALLIVNARGEIVLVNTQFELMFGYHRCELIGKTPEMMLPPELRERHVHHRRGYAGDPRTRAMGSDMALRARRKDGTEFRVLVMLGPVVTPDGICTIAVIRRAVDTDRDSRSTA